MSYWTPYAYLREARAAQRQQQSTAGSRVEITGIRSVSTRMHTTPSTPLTSRFEPSYTPRIVTPVPLLSRFERAAHRHPLLQPQTRNSYPLPGAGIVPPPTPSRREEDRWIFTHRIEPMSVAAPTGQPPSSPRVLPAAVQSPEERAAEKAAQEAMQTASDAAQTAAAQAALVTDATTRAKAAAQRATNLFSRMSAVSPESTERFVSGIRNATTEVAKAANETIEALKLIQAAADQAQAAAITTTNLYAIYSNQVIDSAATSSAIFTTTATAYLNGATTLQQEAASIVTSSAKSATLAAAHLAGATTLQREAASLYAETATIFRNARALSFHSRSFS